MTERASLIENNEEFIKGTYNGIEIYIRKSDGFINATKLCISAKRDFRTFKRSKRWSSIFQYYLKFECRKDVQNCTPLYELKNGYNLMQGQYITPDLIHFVAEWISIEYSFIVKHIMDSINDKVHEVLEEKQLPDTVENAKPVFVEVAKSIAPSVDIELVNQKCWGVRDSAYKLDSWEQQDLSDAIINYKEIKQRLEVAEHKIDEFGEFVKRYHPEFEK